MTKARRLCQHKHVVNPPKPIKENPVLSPEHPWEQGSISNYGTVLFDSERRLFRYWYLAVPGNSGVVTMDGKELPAT